MKLLYFRGNNFGDELNWYIFESLFNYTDFVEQAPQCYFMGIGSILADGYFKLLPAEGTAVIFGAGVRGLAPLTMGTTDPFFVRGPVSSQVTGAKYITDAAYALHFLKDRARLLGADKKYSIALIPYMTHTEQADWQAIAMATGARIVMPHWPTHRILQILSESELVISGAMHGCILADILRIPWVRLRFPTHENEPWTQDVKWQDWLYAMQIPDDKKIIIQTPNTLPENKEKLSREVILKIDTSEALAGLSADSVYNERIEQIREQIDAFSLKYRIGINHYRSIL